MSIYSDNELSKLGFKTVGKHVLISKKASFYNTKNIRIGNHVRIDDFCVLSAGVGGIDIASYIHIAVFSSLIGKGNITLKKFSNISSRVSIYSSSDDYSGQWMTNPMVPSQYTQVTHANVFIGKHVIIGAGSVILPGVTIEEGVAIGALTLIKNKCEAFGVYAGNPAKRIAKRKKYFLTYVKKINK